MKNKEWIDAIVDFLVKFNINFKDINLYIVAFTHSSFTQEMIEIESNERLEFLGDAILGKEISEYLYDKNYSSEGFMTQKKSEYIRNDKLQKISKEMGIETILRTGNAVECITSKMIGDALEALIGAIYKDSEEECKKFIKKHIISQ